jgi:hypothetical protein
MSRSKTPVPHRIGSAPKPSSKLDGYFYVFLHLMNGERPEKAKTVTLRPSEADLILDAYENDCVIMEHEHTVFDPGKQTTMLRPGLSSDDFKPAEPQPVPVIPVSTAPAVRPIDANIQDAVNRISIQCEKIIALKTKYPMLSSEDIRALVISDSIEQNKR